MNDHLIKNYRIALLLNLFYSVLIIAALSYQVKINNLIESFEWYTGFMYLIYPIYLMIKSRQILLEIKQEKDELTISSYSILRGKKEIYLNLNDIIELDFYNGFFIKYKDSHGKTNNTFEINAEPWNNVYAQVKRLKLAVQELEKQKQIIPL